MRLVDLPADSGRGGLLTHGSTLVVTSNPTRTSPVCAYQFNLSWRSERQPIAAESNPRLVFERLFGAGKGAERKANLAARQAQRRPILDFVAGAPQPSCGDSTGPLDAVRA